MDTSPLSPTGETDARQAPQDFMSLFCEEFHCPPSEFEERAFRTCLYWRARVLAPLIRIIGPRYFDRDFALIRYLAKTPGWRDAMNELSAYMEANDTKGGFARKILRIRISARKVGQLAGRLFERHAEEGHAGPVPRRPN